MFPSNCMSFFPVDMKIYEEKQMFPPFVVVGSRLSSSFSVAEFGKMNVSYIEG